MGERDDWEILFCTCAEADRLGQGSIRAKQTCRPVRNTCLTSWKSCAAIHIQLCKFCIYQVHTDISVFQCGNIFCQRRLCVLISHYKRDYRVEFIFDRSDDIYYCMYYEYPTRFYSLYILSWFILFAQSSMV